MGSAARARIRTGGTLAGALSAAVLLGWAWNTATAPGPVCQVQEQHQGKTVLVPRPCADVLPK